MLRTCCGLATGKLVYPVTVKDFVWPSRPSKNLGEQKARSSVYCRKLTVTAMLERTPVDCSEQMHQPAGRRGRQLHGATSDDVGYGLGYYGRAQIT